MYLCKFDATGRRTETLLEGVHYNASEEAQKLADGYVSVSDDDYAYYVGNHGNGDNDTGYVRGTDGKPTSAPARVVTLDEVKASKISALTALLTQTDYEAIKFAEGQLTATQYSSMKTAREAWRTAINTIQAATTVDAVNAVTYSTNIPAVD